MHPTMDRLYTAARTLRNLSGQTVLANALLESPQTVKNWESRGVSFQGALKAQELIGCDANWIVAGTGPTSIALPLSAEVRERVQQLDGVALRHLENVIRAHLGMPVVNADAPPPPARLRAAPVKANVLQHKRNAQK